MEANWREFWMYETEMG